MSNRTKIIGNPLYSWSHLELKRFFGIDLLINEENAEKIWTQANEILAAPDFRRREIAKSNVEVICTTDDPADDLHYHQLLAHEEPDLKVLPSFRPDKALNIEKKDLMHGSHYWKKQLTKRSPPIKN